MPVGHVIVLGFTQLGAVEQCVRRVKACGLTPFLVLDPLGADYSHLLPAELILRSANVNVDLDALVRDVQGGLRALSPSAPNAVRAIINFQDRMWLCYIRLCEAFPQARGLSPEAVNRTAVKPNLRFLATDPLLTVPYSLVPCRPDAGDVLPYLAAQGPLGDAREVVVKPMMGMASEAVSRVSLLDRDVEEKLQAAVQRVRSYVVAAYGDGVLCRLLEHSDPVPVNSLALIEEFLPGPREFSFEGMSDHRGDPMLVVDQEKTRTLTEPVFRDLEYLAGVPARKDGMRFLCVKKLLELSGHAGWPFHVELKEDANGTPRPVEFNPRVGGGSIPDLIQAIHGINVIDYAITTLLADSAERYFATTVVQPTKAGRLVEYSGLKDVASQPDCIFLKKIVEEGTSIRLDRETYLVEYCIVGHSAAGAESRAKSLQSMIEVRID